MHALSIIVPFYNSEEYITECISYIKRQRNQDFDLILVNDGSTDRSEPLLDEALADYDKKAKYIKLETNQGHAHARNVGMQAVETPYFMFVDADDKLATYAVNFYLKHIQSFDGLIAPVHEFTLNMPQFVDQDRVQIKYLDTTSNPNSFLRKNTACNIIFKTAIVKGHNLQFNESLKVYTDWSFILDYVQYAEHFIRVINFPFYFKGEVYDPFETNTLSEQNFDFLFEDYAKSFIDALSRVKNKQTRTFIKQRMLNTLHNDFSPNLRETAQRFATHQDALAQVVRHLGVDILKEHKILFTLETFALAFRKIGWASSINRLRFVTRHAKRVALRQKGKELSQYFLTDKDENVNNKTVVFESFGGKNYSDSPKYIYEYMKDHYPELNYRWVFTNPETNRVPGEALKVKKNSAAYYQAYSEAKVWVSNARLPLFLNKKENQTYIQTWHGTPLKRLANDMKVVRMPGTTTSLYKRNFHKETSRWDYLISPNRYSSEIFRTAFWMPAEKTLEIGYPRNDILVNRADDVALQAEIREELNIQEGKKIIMYAPTWRDDEFVKKGSYTFKLKIDLARLQETIGDDYVVLLRMHYLIANALDLKGFEDFAIDVSNYNDISRLYLISDCLITDYSSVMFDYGILKRPQLFFPYDIEKYATELRGFYIDYHNDLPGPIYTDPDALIEGLKNIELIRETYQDQIEAFHQRFCSMENGRAAQYIGDMIYNEIQKSSD
ncbi:bifunctional glycosyltransferase/CDP-glycerol:glycerophosphate glycerophosphotransferase [Staphylococcus pseudintermedius]|uniref:bifunctional glycosyltransferase/CDP-glycerol:glycerophosphate glycerophosphotransferase n=1 Tax=Staphylococcus pseudintermedius TaxID=283734 RepID=UPI001261EE2B|nr:bifunctional glycosyltransferase family 2 protein/CDP-glycerol:glycerophosphate glycerophosphotransferase [Staphylococcus pseudintermedius]EGQ1611085.1 glycosyltransferase [Staphylococcus pseudintermedius]EGQ1753531.1 CDP-glycerol:glycerophosphate glycerophosphotransferase [Staphylococcus pseudintermedius]EGQ3357152.1 glycosyltransferase [Staphylococcus pseudintermedius]EGQ3364786.1 glycosyltransferase [Staphylococcus pseudintermedius]EGQ3433810.1 glycosyltransferase [Staphylococcus pseudin